MIRSFVLSLILVVSLWATNSGEILKRADSYMVSGSQSNQFRAYNDYKNLYLRAMVKNDSNLRLQSLKGIVKSGTALSIDVSKYSQELQELSSKGGYNPPKTKPEIREEPKTEPMVQKQNPKDIHVEPLYKLESVQWDEGRLLLTFDKDISSEQINSFTLHNRSKNRYVYVFDIKTSMLTKAHNLNRAKIDRIKLSQFDPKTVRLVVENSSEISLLHNVDSKMLEIIFESKPKTAPQADLGEKIVLPSKKKSDKVIVIDPGHGGEDPGAIGYNKYKEKAVVFDISKELEKILKARGYRVYMTRSTDRFVKLRDRTKFANDKSANIFVSIHANAVEEKNAKNIQGIECFFLSPSRSERAKNAAAAENSADMSDMNIYGKDSYLNLLNHHNILASNKLAIDLQRGMLAEVNKKYKDVNDNGVKEGPFWVLVGAQMPSVLVEVGFLSHPQEGKRLGEDSYKKALTKGLADGIERYFANCK